MSMDGSFRTNIAKSWGRLLYEIELARNYHQPLLLYVTKMHRNPILEYLLPSLLYIKMVSIPDEALMGYSEERDLTIPKNYRKSLHGKINFHHDQGIISNATALHAVKEKRNAIAHEEDAQASWDELERGLTEIEKTLRGLTLVAKRPNLEFYAERSGAEESTKPDVLFAQDFTYGLKEDGETVVSVSWTEELQR